jgi:hypothetical protein
MIKDEAERQRFLQMYERACLRRLDYRDAVEDIPMYSGIVFISFMVSLFALQTK